MADPPLSPVFVLVFLSLVFQVSFEISSLYMTVSRLLLLVLTPILLVKFLSGRFGKILTTDWLVFGFLFWFSISTLKNNTAVFLTFAGSNMLILLGGYLMGRAYIRGPRAFRQMIYLYGSVVVLTLPLAIHETITSTMSLARMIDQVPGISASIDVDYPQRRGLYRVQVTFPHPIHYGLFCTICFAMVVVGLKDRITTALRWLWGGAIALCCFLSVSSGPLMGIMAQIGLIFYAFVTRGAKRPWIWLLRFSIVGYVLLDLASTRPAYYAVAERLAFSSGTAYARKLILEFGTQQIARTPIFGYGAGKRIPLPHWMTGSMDNHWLLLAVVYGVPAFALLFGAYVYTIWKSGRAGHEADPETRHLQLGWSIATVGIMLTIATVAIWSEIATLIFVAFGAGVWMVVPRDNTAPPVETKEAAGRRGLRYTRFPARTASIATRTRSA
ncbi:hypothetical protein OCH239_12725 [Roseivivax halodurans JCM 10272]|uniref:Polymerase n=1 Tax=Roseivivax halodurans JCM 10272 TaxID=1449350 RepID=X7EDF5_9RHOB|nr:O-antigen ligase family protein [Roseivivax halodurans]ETX13236.1 hypothetical protein OCH239_12725 [Roseivivax halodurans JCM 10272]